VLADLLPQFRQHRNVLPAQARPAQHKDRVEGDGQSEKLLTVQPQARDILAGVSVHQVTVRMTMAQNGATKARPTMAPR
jgi:hypothetical protein